MKVTDSEIIKNGEKELLDSITGDLDWKSIEQIIKKKHNFLVHDDIEYKNGDIVVYNNQIAYKVDFDVKVTLSILLDRQGNYLSLATSGDLIQNELKEDSEQGVDVELIEPANIIDDLDENNDDDGLDEIAPMQIVETIEASNENISQMASEIADMISDINED
ncbi:MAG: hypothetical protein HQK65_03945 [Desulfamplus sp.]|nr:hypothetical protein [Desulfamplus sp.]